MQGYRAITVAAFLAQAAAAQEYGPIPGRILVSHRRNSDPAVREMLIARHGARVRGILERLRISILDVDEKRAPAVMEALRSSGAFEFVERDYYAKVDAVPNDPSYSSQWHLDAIGAPQAWDVGTGKGITIGIVDSGVDSTHPDLKDKVLPGWSFLKNSSDTADVLGHGTAVAGVAAAATNNLTGIAGVAGDSQILPVAVVDSNGYASYSNIAAGIQYAVDHGARIVNVSIGGTASSSILESAVNYAWSNGAVVFAAAMNTGGAVRGYPAGCSHAIAVSATDGYDELTGFSSFGAWISLSAPGTGILSTENGGGYGYWSGTSFASPVAAGVGALVLSVNPSLSPAEVLVLLERSSDDLGMPGFDSSYGYGRVNAGKATAAAADSAPTQSSEPDPTRE